MGEIFLLPPTTLIIEREDQVAANPDIWMRGCRGEDLGAADQVHFTRLYQPYGSLYCFRWI